MESKTFPLFFLTAMIPLPEAVCSQMAEWMRQAITWPAVALTKPLGILVHRTGYNIHLPRIELYVAHSGTAGRATLSCRVIIESTAFARDFQPNTAILGLKMAHLGAKK
jgi:hypothetical protein